MKNGSSFRVDQTNNCYIFPGMGLGIKTVKAKRISDKMFMAAAIALAECSPARHNPNANILPPFTEIRHVSLKVAIAVAKEAIASGLSDYQPKETLEEDIQRKMWMPNYLSYKKIE